MTAFADVSQKVPSADKTAADWTWQSVYPAPAKLNLFLHVVGRRDDGYHLLQTLFTFVDWADELTFSPRNDRLVLLATPTPGVPPQQDLCVRAATRLQEVAGVSSGVTIRLQKRLPQGGGLGGGSSDAATTLLALNHLWQCGLSGEELEEIALGLGADVPVFVRGVSAFAEGVGEQLTPFAVPPAFYLIVHPGVSVPTAQIFGSPDLCRNHPRLALENLSHQSPMSATENDLQAVATALFPAVGKAVDFLRAYCPLARMTGSGACVFAAFTAAKEAGAAAAQLPAVWQGQIARGLSTHPLLALVPVRYA